MKIGFIERHKYRRELREKIDNYFALQVNRHNTYLLARDMHGEGDVRVRQVQSDFKRISRDLLELKFKFATSKLKEAKNAWFFRKKRILKYESELRAIEREFKQID